MMWSLWEKREGSRHDARFALGQEQTLCNAIARSGLPLKADISQRTRHVRFGSKADVCTAIGHVRFTPRSGHDRQLLYVSWAEYLRVLPTEIQQLSCRPDS